MTDATGTTSAIARKRHAILGARTRRLARPRKIDAPASSISCLVCESGGNLYGIPLMRALRVTPFTRAAPAPSSDPALIGVLARGGFFYHVFDLGRLVGARTGGAGGHVVLLRGVSPTIALRVDVALRVAELVELTADEGPAARGAAALVSGLARALQPELLEGRTVSLLDIDQLASGARSERVEGD